MAEGRLWYLCRHYSRQVHRGYRTIHRRSRLRSSGCRQRYQNHSERCLQPTSSNCCRQLRKHPLGLDGWPGLWIRYRCQLRDILHATQAERCRRMEWCIRWASYIRNQANCRLSSLQCRGDRRHPNRPSLRTKLAYARYSDRLIR